MHDAVARSTWGQATRERPPRRENSALGVSPVTDPSGWTDLNPGHGSIAGSCTPGGPVGSIPETTSKTQICRSVAAPLPVGQAERVSDEIRRADENTDDVVTEAWERVTDEPHIRCVDASYLAKPSAHRPPHKRQPLPKSSTTEPTSCEPGTTGSHDAVHNCRSRAPSRWVDATRTRPRSRSDVTACYACGLTRLGAVA